MLLVFSVSAATELELLQSPSSLRLQEAHSARFSCLLQHNGNAVNGSFYWHHIEITFSESQVRNVSTEEDGRITFFSSNVPSFHSVLIIEDVRYADSGLYYCNMAIHGGSHPRKITGTGTRLIIQEIYAVTIILNGGKIAEVQKTISSLSLQEQRSLPHACTPAVFFNPPTK
ncbi:T-cell surface glycoprotein CD8 beta chain-like [Chiloscyllium plagiosum]|uniref:T-cell surface glycoprotein CD8 beta chain-like n=1 Tax=Chiloscyllium plagiosum TaxID=36176 RepID=UPI001CB7BB18|nr:T-cell surface glycoprotein CD8 beta chain-like [Chiloscyllium plagiosum]